MRMWCKGVARCVRDAEARFESDIFNGPMVAQLGRALKTNPARDFNSSCFRSGRSCYWFKSNPSAFTSIQGHLQQNMANSHDPEVLFREECPGFFIQLNKCSGDVTVSMLVCHAGSTGSNPVQSFHKAAKEPRIVPRLFSFVN